MLYRKNVRGAENFHIIKTRFGIYQVLKEKCRTESTDRK